MISSNLDAACQKVADDFCESIKQEFEKNDLECICKIDFKERYSGIYVWRKGWKHLSIAFQFQRYDKEFSYGFLKEEPEKYILPEKLMNSINSLPNNSSKNSLLWPWFQLVENPYNNWDDLEAWQAIFDGRMISMILEKTQSLLKLTDEIEM